LNPLFNSRFRRGEFGKYEEAVDLWERVLKIDPRNTKALVNMGGVLLRLKRYEENNMRISCRTFVRFQGVMAGA